MLEKSITYTDFRGNEVTEMFTFNLTTTELVELEVEHNEGLEEAINRMVHAQDRKSLVAEFRKVVLQSYGELSPDGKRFIKTPEMYEEFRQSAAYDKLFIDILSDDEVAAKFMMGIIPKEMSQKLGELNALSPEAIEEYKHSMAEPKPMTTPMPPPPPSA